MKDNASDDVVDPAGMPSAMARSQMDPTKGALMDDGLQLFKMMQMEEAENRPAPSASESRCRWPPGPAWTHCTSALCWKPECPTRNGWPAWPAVSWWLEPSTSRLDLTMGLVEVVARKTK